MYISKVQYHQNLMGREVFQICAPIFQLKSASLCTLDCFLCVGTAKYSFRLFNFIQDNKTLNNEVMFLHCRLENQHCVLFAVMRALSLVVWHN